MIRASSPIAAFRTALLPAAVALAFGAGSAQAQSAADGAKATPGVIGLVMGEWKFALHQTPKGKDECPDGFQHDLSANYAAEYPTPEARKAREQRYGYFTNRGPNGENVFYHPTVHTKTLPFRAVQGTTAIGLNLDGEVEGKGTAETLPHGNFTSPTGERGVDNQLYRVLGCTPGWREGGGIVGPAQIYMRSENYVRKLVEITGVNDEQNDDDVTVTFYRGLDALATDSKDQVVPWLSQRIDYKYGRRFVYRTKGRIADGVLVTDPIDLRMPFLERTAIPGERVIRKARFRLKLNPTGATGMLGGYADLENFYLMYSKTWGAHKVADIEGWDGPATYEALQKYADYKDPKTGKPVGISAAYEVGFTRTFIVHTPEGEALLAKSGLPTTPVAPRPGQLASR